jgi:hypothetical protein
MVKVPMSACPYCGTYHDGATSVESGYTPRPGDVTFCIECLGLAAFSDDLTLRKVPREEMETWDPGFAKYLLDILDALIAARGAR